MDTSDFSLTAAQVQAAQDGDRQALEDLFARYLPRVVRMVAAKTGQDWRQLGLDDDLVQETMLDAYAAIRDGKIASEGAFCAWMSRCVLNNLHDEVRRARTLRRGGGKVERFSDVEAAFLSESVIAGAGATASQHLAARELEARLESLLQVIDPRYREVICLRVYCGMSYREVADHMGIENENTANVLFLRARAELQARLDGAPGDA